MKQRSSLLLARAIAVLSVILAIALTIASCSWFQKDEPQDITTTEPGDVVIPEGPETGLYYYDNNGTEYTLKLHNGNQFTLFNGAEKKGTYTVAADGAMSFTFAEAADGTATATRCKADGIICKFILCSTSDVCVWHAECSRRCFVTNTVITNNTTNILIGECIDECYVISTH